MGLDAVGAIGPEDVVDRALAAQDDRRVRTEQFETGGNSLPIARWR